MDLVVTAAEQGSWILLQNCHLFNPIKDKMEKLLSIMENPHRDFRLWITTDTAGAIPIEILQRCFKGENIYLKNYLFIRSNKHIYY